MAPTKLHFLASGKIAKNTRKTAKIGGKYTKRGFFFHPPPEFRGKEAKPLKTAKTTAAQKKPLTRKGKKAADAKKAN